MEAPSLAAKMAWLNQRPAMVAPLPSLVNLSGNEWPEPPPGTVRDAMKRALDVINRYPDPGASALRSRLGEVHGVPPSQIAVGNGSCELLLALGDALLDPSVDVAYAWPSFTMYRHLAPATGAGAVEVPLDASGRHDLNGLRSVATARTRLLLLCNPNNPTGTALPLADVVGLLEDISPTTCVVLDEAYVEFNSIGRSQETPRLLELFPNLVILRTFSKFYSLAGARIGYGLFASERLRTATDQVRQIYPCNAVAQAGALAALDATDEYGDRAARARELRAGLLQGLRALGLSPFESEANLVWTPLDSPAAELSIVQGLRERGVLVTAGSSIGAGAGIRITLALRPELERLLMNLNVILKERVGDKAAVADGGSLATSNGQPTG